MNPSEFFCLYFSCFRPQFQNGSNRQQHLTLCRLNNIKFMNIYDSIKPIHTICCDKISQIIQYNERNIQQKVRVNAQKEVLLCCSSL